MAFSGYLCPALTRIDPHPIVLALHGTLFKGFWLLNKERLPRKLPLRSSLTYDGIARNVPSVY